MLRAVLAALAVACISTAAVADSVSSAVPADAAPPMDAAPSPVKLELARKLLEVLRLKQQIKTMLADMGPILMDQELKRHPGVTPEQRKIMEQVINEAMADFTDKTLERWVPIYAQTFSEQDMQAMIAFYSSPAGQSFLDKSPQLSAAGAKMVRELLPDLQRDLLVRLCSKLDCFGSAPQPPAQQPS